MRSKFRVWNNKTVLKLGIKFNTNLAFLHIYFIGDTLRHELTYTYRKQIARQLRTQYVEDIHRPKYYTVTLKSRLRSLKVIESGTI